MEATGANWPTLKPLEAAAAAAARAAMSAKTAPAMPTMADDERQWKKRKYELKPVRVFTTLFA